MKKILLPLLACACLVGCKPSQPNEAQPKSLHSYTVTDIEGEPFALSQLKGKKVMIVNVASKCRLTSQYDQLQKLYAQNADKGFVILGFPCNDFAGQEPGSNEEVHQFCRIAYGANFPMMAKISIKGDDVAPVYRWLTRKELNGVADAQVTWNFQKFLIDEKGNWVASIVPDTLPDCPEVIAWIEGKPFVQPPVPDAVQRPSGPVEPAQK